MNRGDRPDSLNLHPALLNRRDFIKKMGAGAMAAGGILTGGGAIAATPDVDLSPPYPDLPPMPPEIPAYNGQALFFDQHQYALVATLAAIIVPSDDGPGATEAGVADAVDRFVAGSENRQRAYTRGLKWIDDTSHAQCDMDFQSLDIDQQIRLMRRMDRSAALRRRPVSGALDRLDRKIEKIWDDQFGVGPGASFFKTIQKDVISAFYASPVSWQNIGFYGPPQPVGYLDFSQPPAGNQCTGTVRPIPNTSCKVCHPAGKHPRGKLIDHACTACHRPHAPWPSDKDAVSLEDRVEVIFASPDRKKGDPQP